MTVMFCDLVGSTQLSRQLDPEELRHVIRSFQDACAGVIARYEGYISRYMGDGILALFGYPQAHDDDAQRAARAGLDLLEKILSLRPTTPSGSTKLSVRIGISTGLVVAGDLIGEHASEEKAIVGETPNLAARLQSLAKPDSILVSPATYRLIRHTLTCRSAGAHPLKGYPDAVQVYEVTPSDLTPGATTESKERELTPLVGRDRDVTFLMELWAQAKEGAGRLVLVQGEPGIGKSRLVREIKRACEPESYYTLECRCSAYFTNSALYPVIELLRRLLKLSTNDTQKAVLEKLEAAVGSSTNLPQSARELASTLLLSQDTSEERVMLPSQRQRRQPFEAIVAFLFGLSEHKPVLFIVEDLHWVDPSTLQLLGLLVDQVPLARILILVTARPEFRPEWLTRSHTSQHTLGRLMPTEAETMVTALTVDTPLSESVRRLLVTKTDGVPLFIEELTQTVIDFEVHADSEKVGSVLSGTGPVVIPETLRDSLMARLDRLQDAKPIAQLAAVLGRNFSYQLLSAVANLDEFDLNDRLTRLVKAELFYQRGMPPDSVYHFKHSLIQDIAYDSLLNSKRREFHGRIAAIIEKEFPQIANTHPELTARHYTLAGLEQKAAEFWKRASELALQRSADVEAITHAREGLRLAIGLEDSRVRDELALALQVTLGASLSATKGYAIPEVDRAYSEALRLCNRQNAKSDLFPILRGLHSFYLLRGPLTRANELGSQLVEVAEKQEEPVALSEATRCLGWTLFCSGKMCEGRELIQRAISLYDRALSREHTRQNVSDTGGVGLINLAWMNWFLGYTDEALVRSREAINLAREIDHPFTLAYALCMGAAVHQCRREPDAVESLTEEAISLASKQAFRYWIAWGTSLQGWAVAQLNGQVKGIKKLQEGLAAYRATGATLFEPYILSMLAESLARQGDKERAADLLREALNTEQQREIHFFSAETHRLLGEMMWALGKKDAAMASFDKALTIARTQKARSLELRTATSLVRIVDDDDKAGQARERLGTIVGTFEEGHDTADYREAMRFT